MILLNTSFLQRVFSNVAKSQFDDDQSYYIQLFPHNCFRCSATSTIHSFFHQKKLYVFHLVICLVLHFILNSMPTINKGCDIGSIVNTEVYKLYPSIDFNKDTSYSRLWSRKWNNTTKMKRRTQMILLLITIAIVTYIWDIFGILSMGLPPSHSFEKPRYLKSGSAGKLNQYSSSRKSRDLAVAKALLKSSTNDSWRQPRWPAKSLDDEEQYNQFRGPKTRISKKTVGNLTTPATPATTFTTATTATSATAATTTVSWHPKALAWQVGVSVLKAYCYYVL